MSFAGPFAAISLGLFGLVFGSFANVVIWRFPRRESLSTPGSHCPRCDHPVRWYDNVPLVSWLLLGGRCRDCGAPISVRYPVVEALSGILWLAAGLRFGVSLRTAVAVGLFYLLMILAFIDLDTMKLPNPLVGLLAAAGGIAIGVSVATGIPAAPLIGVAATGLMASPVVAGVVGAVAGAGTSALIALGYGLVRKAQGFGMGDVKLLGAMGLFLGAYSLLALFIAALVGSVAAIAMAAKSAERTPLSQVRIPFGPFLALGGVVCVLWGPSLWGWYLGVLGV
jgi:leader peptidase (prepilin peptidase) / N-methyltransferase